MHENKYPVIIKDSCVCTENAHRETLTHTPRDANDLAKISQQVLIGRGFNFECYSFQSIRILCAQFIKTEN